MPNTHPLASVACPGANAVHVPTICHEPSCQTPTVKATANFLIRASLQVAILASGMYSNSQTM